MLYEGGVRNSYIFRWPGKIKSGSTNDTPINSVDLYPTLVEVAGAKAPDNYPLDGISYVGLLTGEKQSLDRDAIYWHFPGYLGAGKDLWRTKPAGAIRSGDWKLVEFFEDGKLELYNLKEDISEQRNLAKANPEKANELHDKLVAWRKSIGAQMPTPNTAKVAADAKGDAKKGKGQGKRKARRAAKAAAAGDDE